MLQDGDRFCHDVMALLSCAGQPLDEALTCSDAEGDFHLKTLAWEGMLENEVQDSDV